MLFAYHQVGDLSNRESGMKTIMTIVLVLIAVLPSPGRAEQSAEDIAFAAALEARLKTLELERQNCGRRLSAAARQQFETIDSVQRRYNDSRRGGYTLREEARLDRAQRNVESAVDDTYDCVKRIESERASVKAILSNPARLRPESERLRNELRRELLALLTDVRSASAKLGAQSNYDEFVVKLGVIGNRLQSIRSNYAIPLSRGDHKALGAPLSDACNALYATGGEWKRARQAAEEVAGTQAAVARAGSWEVEFFQRRLTVAQRNYADAQKRLADYKGTALALVQAATRVAQEDSQKERTVTVNR